MLVKYGYASLHTGRRMWTIQKQREWTLPDHEVFFYLKPDEGFDQIKYKHEVVLTKRCEFNCSIYR
jgi:hypothetical protein